MLPTILELYDINVKPENWCIPKWDNVIRTLEDIEYEIGIYKEENGSLTLQIFANDDIIVCKTIKEGE